MRLPVAGRAASIVAPLVLAGIVFAVDVRAGVTVTVLLLGMAAATAVYVKNRTDRHNAAVDRGEIRAIADPNFRAAGAEELPPGGLERAGWRLDSVGRVARFDGGWVVRGRNPKLPALLLGDDGGWARFDPRTVTDLWAVGEYRAGRGRDG
jgi:hypothetical protein